MTKIEYYTATEVAEICRVQPATVHEWLKSGLLKGEKPGRKWLITKDDLTSFLRSRHG